jgi:hypothetical protein
MALFPATAAASEASGTSEQFLGWSEDGTHWAVASIDEGDSESLYVYKGTSIVLTLCMKPDLDSNPYAADDCKASDDTKVTYLEPSRINIEKHKHLKVFKLKRVKKSWRKDFKKKYTIKGTHPSKNWNDKHCSRGWKLIDRATKKVATSHKKDSGCLRARGGYLHPKASFVLVKQNHHTWSTSDEDGFWTHDSLSVVAVPLTSK